MNLKQRLQNRCRLLINTAQQLLTDLEQIQFAEDLRAAEDLKQKFIKYFTKNILMPVQNLHHSLQQKTDDGVSKAQAEIMQKIVAYLFQFREKRLRAGQCKNHRNHFELLLHAARNQLDRKLNELAALASLMPLRSEEKAPDAKVEKEAFVLQQQQDASNNDQHFLTALTNTAQWSRTVKANVSVFISYAWPSDDRPWEKWTQPFLQTLKKHLEVSGITVYMDLYDSRYGFNSYHHMDKIDTCDYVILVGTESLQDKFYRGVSAVCYELNMIRKRREQNADERVFSVIPLIINGTLRTALPPEYERFTVIESFMGGSYQKTINELLAKLYSVSPGFPDFARAWEVCKLISTSNVVSSSSSSSSLPTTVVERNSYLEKLKAVYQDRTFSGVQRLFDDEVMSIEDYYVNLALIKEEEQKKKEQAAAHKTITHNVLNRDEATELFGSAEQFFTVQEPIELKNIFDLTSNEKVRQTNRLLIIGRAGIGKTTLCQYTINQWAVGKLWSERYQGIFRIPLRNLIASRYRANRDYSLVEIINRECFVDRLTADEQEQVETTLKNHPENYLIILDGYDELSTQAEDAYLINQVESLLQYPEVIVTSRPQSINFAADKKLEVLGFTDENIERYVEHFFKNNEQAKTNLKQQLKQQSLLQSLVHIPLNLELICSAWQKNNWTEELSLTELYQHLVEWLTYRYLKKFHPDYKQPQQQQALENLTALHKEKLCAVWLQHLEAIAWQMRQTGEIYIDKKELFSVETDLQKREENIKQLRESGLLRQTSDKQFYYFSHLTFQEFFAARHVARVIQNAGSQGNAEFEGFQKFFKENKFNPQLQIVWWFVAGLLKEDGKALDHYFNLLLQEPRDITVIGELPLFMHCLEQSDLAKNSRIGQNILEVVSERVLVILKLNDSEVKKAQKNLVNQLKLCSKLLHHKILMGLCVVLKKSDSNVRRSVAITLKSLGEKAATEEVVIGLLAALKAESDKGVVSMIVDALGSLGQKAAIDAVTQELQMMLKDYYLSSFAHVALRRLRGNTTNLMTLEAHRNEYLQREEAKALSKLRKRANTEDAVIKRSLVELQDTHRDVRRKAIEALKQLKEKVAKKEVIQGLLAVMKVADSGERRQATEALGWVGEKATTAEVVEEVVKGLLALLKLDTDVYVRLTAAEALGRLGEKAAKEEVIKELLMQLRNFQHYYGWLETIVEALGKLGEKAAFEEVFQGLLMALKSRDQDVRIKAAEALGRLGEKAVTKEVVQGLSVALNDSYDIVRNQTVVAFTRLGEKATVKLIAILLAVLSDSEWIARIGAIEALGILGEKAATVEVIEKLLKALKNPLDFEMQSKAAEALGRLGKNAVSAEVLQGLVMALKYPGFNVRVYAVVALDSLIQTAARNFFHLLMDLLKVTEKDVNKAVLDYLKRLCCECKFANILVNANQLIFCVTKNNKVTVELPVSVFRQLVIAVQNQLKEDYKITFFLLPQSSFILNSLIQEVTQGNLQQVQNLLAEGVDTRSVDKTGMMAVNKAFDHPVALKLLIEQHQPIDLLFLENNLSELNSYYGDVDNKTEDERLLNKLTLSLTGMENISQKKQEQRKRLLAHFQSFGNNKHQELEGLIGQEFLALHVSHLLQLLAEVNRGRYEHQIEKSQRLNVISYLKRELLITVQAFHFGVLTDIANQKNSVELQQSVAKAVLNALSKLAEDEELIYQTGYAKNSFGHCIYIAFRRIHDQLVIRVDNLWEADIENRHQQLSFPEQTKNEKYKPYFISVFNYKDLSTNTTLLNYLVDMISSKELLPSQALQKLYPIVNQNSEIALNYSKNWPAKRKQIVGNCVVKSFFVGAHIRLGKKLHHQFRSWESNLFTNTVGVNLITHASSSTNVTTQQSTSSTNTLLRGEVAQTSVPMVTVPSHEALMQTLARELNLDYQRDVFAGSVIEQMLIDLTGIHVQQKNPSFRRNSEDQSTKFYLNFPDEKSKQAFIDFYQTNYPGIILRILTEQNKIRIDFDTLRLVQEIIPQMKQYLQTKNVLIQQTSQPQSAAKLISTQGIFASTARSSAPATPVKNENTCLVM